MIQTKYGDFVVSIAGENLDLEFYDNDSYMGVIIRDGGTKYDIIYHHKIDWNRMIINRPDGSYQDMPFHEGTFRFLPEYVKVERVA